MSAFDDDEEEVSEGLVRQNSSFVNLSADSWVTVESEYEQPDTLLFPKVS